MAEMDDATRRVLGRLAAIASRSSAPTQVRGDAEWVAGYRDQILQMREFAGDAAGLPAGERFHFEGPDGPLDLRCYRGGATGLAPGIVAFHGGGFVAGSLETHDLAFRSLARATGATVLAVEYRRPPEHVFPAAVEDCYAAAAHVADRAAVFGVDPARLFVLGDSAGGGLAACVAIMARDRGGPRLAGQVCLYPNTDLRVDRSYPSMSEHDGTVVKLDELHRCLRLYLAGADPAHPHASPALASLASLPAALVVTCELDPLRDEGEAYAEGLRRAGCDVTHTRLAGAVHGLLQMAGELPDARTMLDGVAGWVGQHLATTDRVLR